MTSEEWAKLVRELAENARARIGEEERRIDAIIESRKIAANNQPLAHPNS